MRNPFCNVQVGCSISICYQKKVPAEFQLNPPPGGTTPPLVSSSCFFFFSQTLGSKNCRDDGIARIPIYTLPSTFHFHLIHEQTLEQKTSPKNPLLPVIFQSSNPCTPPRRHPLQRDSRGTGGREQKSLTSRRSTCNTRARPVPHNIHASALRCAPVHAGIFRIYIEWLGEGSADVYIRAAKASRGS